LAKIGLRMDVSSKENPNPVLKNFVKNQRTPNEFGIHSFSQELDLDTDTDDDEDSSGEADEDFLADRTVSSLNMHYTFLEIGGAELEDNLEYLTAVSEGGDEIIETDNEPEQFNYADDESSDSEDESQEEPNYFVPGWFTIVNDTVMKHRALVSSPVVRKLKAGNEVFIKRVAEINSRTRGLLRKGGWISIKNHITNKVFAERKPDMDFTTIRKKKKSAKRVRFAPESRSSLRSLKRGTVNSLSALYRRGKADPPSNPIWYQQRFYYECDSTDTEESDYSSSDEEAEEVEKEQQLGNKSAAQNSTPLFNITCEYKKLPSPLEHDDIEKQPDSPRVVDSQRGAGRRAIKIPCLQVRDMVFRKSSEDSSVKDNFSSPSIDLQSIVSSLSSEDFSLQAESPSQSSEDESDNEAPCFTYGSWGAKLEKDVFTKDFDREAFLKSLNDDAEIFSPPDSVNGRSFMQSPRFTKSSKRSKAECENNDDEQTAV